MFNTATYGKEYVLSKGAEIGFRNDHIVKVRVKLGSSNNSIVGS